jgi:ribosomal protein S18 acetylase RimI-like enzyme
MAPDYTSAYATPLPFLGALETGLIPAMTEELWFRLLLISGVLWLTRTFTPLSEKACRLLALLIPGALWGFAHTSYVRDPFYLRGIELTLAGVLFEGLFFLRFDLATTIVAHFAYNAGLGALPLLRSGEPYFVASGVVVLLAMLAPTVPYLFRELRRRLRGESREVIRPRIRAMGASDREGLEALSIDGLDWSGLLKDPDAVVLGLEIGDEIAGTAMGRMTNGDEAEVLALYVDSAWRRRYWGSELLDELSGRLQERGAETVHAEVEVEDKRAVRFMISQPWRQARVIFDWPSEPPTLPDWRTLLEKLGLKRLREQAMED